MGQKIPEHLDDPIDNILYRFCDGLSPSFKATGHTPNLITTYSLLTVRTKMRRSMPTRLCVMIPNISSIPAFLDRVC
jgi:hypothetical protein